MANASKIRLTAPPVEGKANAHLLAFLGRLSAAKSLVSLESGELNRQKRVRIRRPTRLPEELGITASTRLTDLRAGM